VATGGISDCTGAKTGYHDMIKTRHPLGSGCVNDVSVSVEFVLTEKEKWISGQQILVDRAFSVHSNHVL
jgi:hypothetical protein